MSAKIVTPKVLDSYALLAYFEGQPAGLQVRDLFKESAEQGFELFVSVVNWGEVLYITESRQELESRNKIETLIAQMHVTVVEVDQEITRQAATYKARGGISYSDCFAAALAKLKNAELVTGDQEFEKVENDIKIFWIK